MIPVGLLLNLHGQLKVVQCFYSPWNIQLFKDVLQQLMM